MDVNSIEASIYQLWENNLRVNLDNVIIPPEYSEVLSRPSVKQVIDNLSAPDGRFGDDPLSARDDLIIASLKQKYSMVYCTLVKVLLKEFISKNR